MTMTYTNMLRAAQQAARGSLKDLGEVLTALIHGDDLYISETEVASTAAEIDRVADVSGRLVAAGATLSVTEALHDGKTILLDTAAGSVCTLPASSGGGARFRFVISTVATSNSHIVKVANATDVMAGVIIAANDTDASSSTWETAATSDTITLNRSTTGSTIKGEWIEVEDIAAGFWAVRGVIAATGAEATPFSAAV